MGMSVEQYERQKLSGRFRIITVEDAKVIAVPGSDCYRDDYQNLLVEFVGDRAIRILGSDGGEPEDQLLTRDWAWVAYELNVLAAK